MYEFVGFRAHSLAKMIPEWVIEGNYGHGWREEFLSSDYKEVRENYRLYLANGPGEYKIRSRKIENPDHGRFKVGQLVKIAPFTDSFAAGFSSGRVTKVGIKYVHVQWNMNEKVIRKFVPELITPVLVQ